jgi:TPR repeat protein
MNALFFRRWFSPPPSPVRETVESQAERGDANAQFSLGLKFANGEESTLDYPQAARWYLKAAEQSHALAQFNLGIMYDRGQGVPVDKAQSILWMDRAARLGDAAAQHALGIAYHRASLERKPENASESRIEAYKWFQLAAGQGCRDSDIASGLVILQMTNEDVADGNRRAAAFVAAQPDPTPSVIIPKGQ